MSRVVSACRVSARFLLALWWSRAMSFEVSLVEIDR